MFTRKTLTLAALALAFGTGAAFAQSGGLGKIERAHV